MKCPVCGGNTVFDIRFVDVNKKLILKDEEIERLQPFEKRNKRILEYLKSGITFTWRKDIKALAEGKSK